MELGVAVATIALGGALLAGSFGIALGAGYDRIGPRFFPYVVAVGLILSGGLLVRDVQSRAAASSTRRREPTNGRAIALLVAALVLSVALLEPAGFVLTATLLFALVARAFASRHPLRDALVGLLLSLFVYLAFTRGLGLVLPRGLLRGLF